MGSLSFYKADKEEKLLVFQEVAKEKNIPVFAVEKDWWVTQTLTSIFELEIAEHLLFKGGTSLSKAWGIINRFSEDIDLALDKSFLGFEKGMISKSQIKKLREKSFQYITTDFYELLKQTFEQKGFIDLKFDFENLGDGDQDPVSILMYYPTVVKYSNYIQPRVKIELGSRSLKEPFSFRKIQSFVGETFSDKPFADKPITIPCVNPERTYLEKLFLLHEEFQRPHEKIRVERLSRHLYDIVKIYQTEHSKKALDKELITSIIKHRERFNGMKGVKYDSLFSPNLNPIPPSDLLKKWQNDYAKMQTNMIAEKSMNFDEIIEVIKKAVKEYNNF